MKEPFVCFMLIKLCLGSIPNDPVIIVNCVIKGLLCNNLILL